MAFGGVIFGGDPFGGLLPSGSTTNRRRRVLMGSGDTMLAVRQSTAFETAIGPVLDASGVAVTDCVVGDFKIKKTSGNFAALNASATLTHVSAGFYDLVLTTSDVDTVGVNVIAIDDTTNTCSPLYLQVVEEAVYDAVFAASAAGYQVPIWAAANSTVNLSATTIKTATDVETDTADIQTRLPAALVSGRIDANVGMWGESTTPVISLTALLADYIGGVLACGISGGVGSIDPAGIDATSFVPGAIDAAALAADAGTEIATAVWAAVARTLTALDEDSTTIDLDATVRAAVGMASANLDTQLDALPTNAELTTALGTADDAVLAAIAALNNPSTAQIATAVLTTAMTEAYRSAGATATLAQFCYEVIAHLGESSISGTTKTLKKLDAATTAKTYTLDSAVTPTSITETT